MSPQALNPGGVPDYFGGVVPNYANSPLPTDAGGNYATQTRRRSSRAPASASSSTRCRASAPRGANDLGQYIPVATANTTAYPGSDYYVIALVEYTEKMHKDLPPTKLRGYVQLNSDGTTMAPPNDKPHYLGPAIVATKGKPVRVKFINKLPTGAGGNLFLPVDTTLMGAGMGPDGVHQYAQNRATLHLHGGLTPWISDGTPHQWTTPASENTPYQKGVSVRNVPDMDGGNEPTGTLTFYYTNEQSARLMFYHDHAQGLTRLERVRGRGGPVRPHRPGRADARQRRAASRPTASRSPSTRPPCRPSQIPLVIQDKSFVPTDTQLDGPGPDLAVRRRRQGPALVPARLHAEPEPGRPRRRQRDGPLGLRSVVRGAGIRRHQRSRCEPAGRAARPERRRTRARRTRRSSPRRSWTRRSSTARRTRS